MGRLAVRGGRCLLDGAFRPADLLVEDGRIAAIVEPGSPIDTEAGRAVEHVDATGLLVAPGFIDLQCNGAVGHDVTTSPGSIPEVARALPQWGVTSWCPTVVTSSETSRSSALDAVRGAATPDDDEPPGAAVLGLHLEGPIISASHPGVHELRLAGLPTDEEITEWIDGGAVSIVTLAPDVPGALDLIPRLVAAGIVVSAGHTDASADTMTAAADAGVRGVTHLFNAMRGLHHREPGAAGAALLDERLTVGVICDGVHVVPDMVALASKLLGERLLLVTDSVAALGQPDGGHPIGRRRVRSSDGAVTTPDGTLAGSVLSMDQAVRNLVDFTGCAAADAVTAATATPARLLGLDDRGVLEVGRRADLVLLDDELHPVAGYCEGALAWRS